METQDKIQPKCQDLKDIDLSDIDKIVSYASIREIESCEYSLTTLFMWKDMYSPHLYYDENYMIIFEHYEGQCYALMPLCKEEYFIESFDKTVEIFEQINEDFEMYCVDEAYAKAVEEHYGETFNVIADRALADYIYSGEALKMLSGKKLRKKKNHINAFLRENPENVVFRLLTADDNDHIVAFLKNWCLEHGDMTSHLEEEINGIWYLLDHHNQLGSKIAGVYINEKLEGLTIGSTINNGREAIVHVEKANSNIRGLYPYINQTFISEIYPDVEIVNREDDLGIEGLRKAKMSYEPLRLEEKYTITMK